MTEVNSELAVFLAQEVVKDMDPYTVYKLAEQFLAQQFVENDLEDLRDDYEEKYDYVFMKYQSDSYANDH